ncbi:MAG: D-tyrosyl-tRNA(Tyr) deacylase, D-tyrosyl-tRNA(Tyr) deacylase [Microgenomates group bacterium GW2011_GWC1_43_13]|uniref:D-aminoacyl-tRNA deacylase n=3 Tax=Candidatus Woeseibacteriota TaxID=1752722 RepID=A0A837IAD5_9BACT|nr:MAG: D-tyrosyl-tRNA(Tyr) deacylase, D-tyrosyl-tRNA(Tyr) deacylase [Microgenomates group bacterium GW2011_GWC1_43_13]KKT33577.1 MAG: D-tyrosyl-tRNA(Tyr) deacylase [Candidatus Woesebacteria bacterium GW2011_GWB1_44_11]KKT55066.1 MAG: D-tyrosyl-tRNA(Tyr) deacylase [Candidatus Woesebacteria bacterium GW2011_GWA1_44_23]OGM76825.1 MAG: D-tyrosyl-tRNA(Tyr) deacylase [Candidatus Woesebacteria bacterium RIFOXYA1_FULL_43_16]OGM83220.1 MAG: D-tyrosyl-tRNA(Tyr) deacylase [Candidatus Woesebacteria bacter
MKLVVQRVKKARVLKVDGGSVVGEIGKGLFILAGIKKGDTEKDVNSLAAKLSKLRIMPDTENKMNLTVADVGGSMLVVSQFTLHAVTSGGNRPSFINAEEPRRARQLYELLLDKLRGYGLTVETGSFGDHMKIEVVLDGPVTIIYAE